MCTEDEKNLFVGMGGIRDHPGLPAISSDYHRGFADNNVGVFTVVTTPLGTVWSVVGRRHIRAGCLVFSPLACNSGIVHHVCGFQA
uniref:Uncharacterized protein n=1 Tax=Aegilops tauschii TaxID=37682 RepID=N1R2W2_AEGTA